MIQLRKVELNEYMGSMLWNNRISGGYDGGFSWHVRKGEESRDISYAYKCREESLEGAESVSAVIPAIETKVSLSTDRSDARGYVREGYAFSPMFTLGYQTEISDKEVISTWLSLEKAN